MTRFRFSAQLASFHLAPAGFNDIQLVSDLGVVRAGVCVNTLAWGAVL